MSEEAPGKIVTATSRIFETGLKKWFSGSTGNPEADVNSGRLKTWFREKVAAAKKIPPEALAQALEDEDVQEQGAQFVSETVTDTINGIRSNLDSAIQQTQERVKASDTDTRSNYQRIRDVLRNEDDPWYTKIAKNTVARVFAWSVPVISYVSAAVASKVTEKEALEEVKDYRSKFQDIYSGLISRFSPQPTPA